MVVISRRDVVRSSVPFVALLYGCIAPSAHGQAVETVKEYVFGATVPTLEEYRNEVESLTGKQSPELVEIDQAIQLLLTLPGQGSSPYEIAFEFHRWRQGLVGRTPEDIRLYKYYSREWPLRGNPVIMSFFDATKLRKIEGDYTYWCAAFVSWCIARSVGGVKSRGNVWPYPEGAATRAYRGWGQDVEKDLKSSPKRGDLAVFQRTDNPAQGHIGFVDKVDKDTIWLLGGNQGAQNEHNGGEVNIAKFSRTTGKSLMFHSFRRHEVLQVV